MMTRTALRARIADLTEKCLPLMSADDASDPLWDELHRALAELHAIQALEVRR